MDVRFFVQIVGDYVREIHMGKSEPSGADWHEITDGRHIFRLATEAERARLQGCQIRARVMDDGNVFFYQIKKKRRKRVYNIFA